MAEETNFIPRKVTNPNDFLDRKSYLCICNVFCNSRAITDGTVVVTQKLCVNG